MKTKKSYKEGGKFQEKYLKGSSNRAERDRLMSEIASIYDRYRGGDKKKPFPPKVKARLKNLMKRRDKI